MKKQNDNIKRILGRTLAREMTKEELQRTQGGGLKKTSLSYPPDND